MFVPKTELKTYNILSRGVVILLKVEGPKLLKSFWALFVSKSGGAHAQTYFYLSLSQKQKTGWRGPGPPGL